ncbi:addiction module protein [Myxococcota bacterium]|nr:addiction module protein [Myxococcota bacterium]
MARPLQKLTEEALVLDPAERIELANTLYESLATPNPLTEWELACVEESERRLEEHERLGGPTYTWEEVRAEILERLARR